LPTPKSVRTISIRMSIGREFPSPMGVGLQQLMHKYYPIDEVA